MNPNCTWITMGWMVPYKFSSVWTGSPSWHSLQFIWNPRRSPLQNKFNLETNERKYLRIILVWNYWTIWKKTVLESFSSGYLPHLCFVSWAIQDCYHCWTIFWTLWENMTIESWLTSNVTGLVIVWSLVMFSFLVWTWSPSWYTPHDIIV